MAGVNKVILIGNLGQDPEVRHLEGDKVVANVSLATTESYKDRSGQRVDMTEWHDLELWDGLARVAEQYLRKGSQIYVEGRIRTDTWQDEQGNDRKKVRLRVNSMPMLGGRGGSNGGSTNDGSQSSPSSQTASLSNSAMGQGDDDLPF